MALAVRPAPTAWQVLADRVLEDLRGAARDLVGLGVTQVAAEGRVLHDAVGAADLGRHRAVPRGHWAGQQLGLAAAARDGVVRIERVAPRGRSAGARHRSPSALPAKYHWMPWKLEDRLVERRAVAREGEPRRKRRGRCRGRWPRPACASSPGWSPPGARPCPPRRSGGPAAAHVVEDEVHVRAVAQPEGRRVAALVDRSGLGRLARHGEGGDAASVSRQDDEELGRPSRR